MSIFKRLKGKTKGDIINWVESELSTSCIRPFKTLYVNFRCLPLKQAIRFPIVIRRKFSIHCLGEIKIESDEICRGMICFGSFNNKFSEVAVQFGKAFCWNLDQNLYLILAIVVY